MAPDSRKRKSIDEVIADLRTLPAIPDTVAEVLILTESEMSSLSTIAGVLERDPALAAKIMQVANSAYFGLPRRVESLAVGVVVLGMRTIRQIVLGVSLLDAVWHESVRRVMDQSFNVHASVVAGTARLLADRLALPMRDEAFLAGLIHDLGKGVLCRNYQWEYASIVEDAGEDCDTLLVLELEAFSYTHADAGAALLHSWNLPEGLCDAVRFHHTRQDERLDGAANPRLASLVRIAELAARVEAPKLTDTSKAVTEEEAWSALTNNRPRIEPERRVEILRDVLEELPSAMPPAY